MFGADERSRPRFCSARGRRAFVYSFRCRRASRTAASAGSLFRRIFPIDTAPWVGVRQKSAIGSSLTCSASRSAAFSLKNVASRCRMTSKIRFRSWRIYSSFGVSSSPTVPKGQPAAGPAGASRSGGWGIPNPLALSERQRAVRRASFSTIVDVCSVVRPGRASTTRGGSRRASGLTG